MSEADAAARIDTIERGYEYLLAYAAQGRQEDRGTEVRATLTAMHVALTGLVPQLQAQFADADYESAFDESRENLLRYLNDADGDGWSIDGRHGEGRDWPFDENGNDPDGWTAQIVVTITRP